MKTVQVNAAECATRCCGSAPPRTYFSVWVRWDPNKAKSNSIHWVSQRVKSKQNCFRTTLRTTSRPNPVVWERLLHTGAQRSAFHTHTPRPLLLLSTLQHKQSRYGAASRFHTIAPGSLSARLQNKGATGSAAPDNEGANHLASSF